jgi:hypothetical protein
VEATRLTSIVEREIDFEAVAFAMLRDQTSVPSWPTKRPTGVNIDAMAEHLSAANK